MTQDTADRRETEVGREVVMRRIDGKREKSA
jgi:hypothetical protein